MEYESYGGASTGTAPEDVRDKAQETASTLVTQAQEVASAQASTQMSRAASALDSVAQTLHDSSSSMSEQQPQVAQFATQAAERVEQVSNYLRDKELRDVISDAEDYARREPLLFLGAAFALGFVAARFLKASSPQQRALQPIGMYGTGRTDYSGARGDYPGSDWNTGSTITQPMSGRFASEDYVEPAGSQIGS